MTKFREDFSSLTTGSIANSAIEALGFTDALSSGTGSGLSVGEDADAIGGNYVRATTPFVGAWSYDAAEETSMNWDVILQIRWSAESSSDLLGAVPLVRCWFDETDDEYWNTTGVSDNDWGSQQRRNNSSSVQSFGEGSFATNPGVNTWVYVRIQHESDGAGNFTRRAKVWACDAEEPASWDLEVTDDKYEWDSTSGAGSEQVGGAGFAFITNNNVSSSTHDLGAWAASNDLDDPVTVSELESGLGGGGTTNEGATSPDRRVAVRLPNAPRAYSQIEEGLFRKTVAQGLRRAITQADLSSVYTQSEVDTILTGYGAIAEDVTVTGAWSFPEATITEHEAALTILETQITNGSILARVASAETISGLWNFTTAPTIGGSTILTAGNLETQLEALTTGDLDMGGVTTLRIANNLIFTDPATDWQINASTDLSFIRGGVSILDLDPNSERVFIRDSSGNERFQFYGLDSTPAMKMTGPQPTIYWYESDAATDEKWTAMRANGGQLLIYSLTDAGAVQDDVLLFNRDGVEWNYGEISCGDMRRRTNNYASTTDIRERYYTDGSFYMERRKETASSLYWQIFSGTSGDFKLENYNATSLQDTWIFGDCSTGDLTLAGNTIVLDPDGDVEDDVGTPFRPIVISSSLPSATGYNDGTVALIY